MLRTLMAASIAVGTLAAAPAAKADMGVQVGRLKCHVDGGIGLILGSRKALECKYEGIKGLTETYDGTITKLGIDVGETTGGDLVWGVFAPTSEPKAGALEGRYYGVSAQATAGVGAGANVLLGGFDKSITLQPLSLEGQTGANIAAGVSEMRLEVAAQ
ncbi:DUF992 domain-containing protein [Acuticoccus mangrovi]|uniref:DUF992 domain-containing protein n=1 Tax=Acuticoccus mangrovi TaxID=2796142 RepID=A0A934IMQ9_9HYPH|nr:DUF992 domain-containing protein [Acuticoccus mangrovi]MBJ3775460.1 DUF992 domain-containing protein [Acuticoccus mangrovi]